MGVPHGKEIRRSVSSSRPEAVAAARARVAAVAAVGSRRDPRSAPEEVATRPRNGAGGVGWIWWGKNLGELGLLDLKFF